MNHVANSKKLTYRSDIDGLRGVAVFLVMAFHFNLPPISGGYIGVDVFFVISGFLITSLLLQETEIFYPLASFYRRRIKRLLPMFLVFVAVTTVFATAFLLPDDYLLYLRSVSSSLAFSANSFFDEKIKDYFSANAHELPFLHVWSLAIEWQFYLVFPVFFLAAKRYLSHRFIFLGLSLLTLVFVSVSWSLTGGGQQAYFYTSARFFELLVGCLAVFCTTDLHEKYRGFVVTCAISLLCGIAVLFDAKTAFPGKHALLVCLLTAVPIIWGRGNRFLESPALVYMGRISYSAYLWHWPCVAFLTYLQIAITPWIGAILLISVIGLAHLSYRWVEIPGRAIQWRLWKLALVFFVAPLLVSMALGLLARRHDGFYQRLGSEAAYIFDKTQPYLDNQKLGCSRGGDECVFGDRESNTTIHLIGDSHAGHYRWFVEELAVRANLKVIGMAHSECLTLPNASHQYRGSGHDARCARAIEADYARISRERPKYVLIAQRWIGYPIDEVKKLEDAVARLVALGITPVILGPVAEDGENLKSCFYRHLKLRQSYREKCTIAQDNPFETGGKSTVAELFRSVQARYPTVIYINPQAVQCKDGYCDAEIDGVPIYDDKHHINGYGATMLAKRYIDKFGNPLLK